MIAAPSYEDFVTAATRELLSTGARLLVSSQYGLTPTAWAVGWDAILADDAPGGGTLYAFTRGDGADAETLQRRVDSLTGGLAGAGTGGPLPVALVYVVVFAEPVAPQLSRAASGLMPRVYVPGLRPRSLSVNVATREIRGGRGSAARRIAELALDAPVGAAGTDVESGRQRHLNTTAQFYELMRGRPPVVTYALIACNVAIFLLMLLTGGAGDTSAVLHGGPFSDSVVRQWGAESPHLVEAGQWWRLVASMFLHAGLTHIMFNMASLLAVGTLAERLYGSARFLVIYLGSGFLGSLVSFAFAVTQGNSAVLSVGASGAIFGVAGALVTVRFQQSEIIPIQLRQRVTASIAPLVLISLVLAGLTPYVDNSAHVGGLLSGMALSFALPVARRAPAGR